MFGLMRVSTHRAEMIATQAAHERALEIAERVRKADVAAMVQMGSNQNAALQAALLESRNLISEARGRLMAQAHGRGAAV